MAESSGTPEASDRSINRDRESDNKTKYWTVVDRAIRWGESHASVSPYDSHDWRMQYWVMYGVLGPTMGVGGFEMTPPPKHGFFARLRGQKPEPVQENPNRVLRHWDIAWGRTPDQQWIIYKESPVERPEGIEGMTPSTAGGFWSATGELPKDRIFPKAENYREVDVFEETNKMLADLEKSYTHEEGVYWTKRR